MIAGWTGNYIAGKIALHAFPPVLLYGLRISMAGVLILPAYWWERRQRTARSWTLRDVPQLVVLGLFGVALNQFLFVIGLSRTSVAHSSIFANTTPILILLLASAARPGTAHRVETGGRDGGADGSGVAPHARCRPAR